MMVMLESDHDKNVNKFLILISDTVYTNWPYMSHLIPLIHLLDF